MRRSLLNLQTAEPWITVVYFLPDFYHFRSCGKAGAHKAEQKAAGGGTNRAAPAATVGAKMAQRYLPRQQRDRRRTDAQLASHRGHVKTDEHVATISLAGAASQTKFANARAMTRRTDQTVL
jgi:hypothetical protein